jgi:hypothetical protein
VTLTARNAGTATSSVTHPATPTAPKCVNGNGEC